MARPSHLEGRLLAVLDECRPRGEPELGARLMLGVALALGVPLLAAARAVPSGGDGVDALRLAAADAPSDSVIERTLEAADGERLTLDLESGASVELRGWDEPRAQFRVRLGGHDADATRVDIARVADGIRVHMWVDTSGADAVRRLTRSRSVCRGTTTCAWIPRAATCRCPTWKEASTARPAAAA